MVGKKTWLLISSAEFVLFFKFVLFFLLGEFDKGHIYIYICFFRTWGVERVGSSYAPRQDDFVAGLQWMKLTQVPRENKAYARWWFERFFIAKIIGRGNSRLRLIIKWIIKQVVATQRFF